MVDGKREQPAKQKEAITAQSTALLAPLRVQLVLSQARARLVSTSQLAARHGPTSCL